MSRKDSRGRTGMWIAVAALVGLAFFGIRFPQFWPWIQAPHRVSMQQIDQTCEKILSTLNLDVENLLVVTRLQDDSEIEKLLEDETARQEILPEKLGRFSILRIRREYRYPPSDSAGYSRYIEYPEEMQKPFPKRLAVRLTFDVQGRLIEFVNNLRIEDMRERLPLGLQIGAMERLLPFTPVHEFTDFKIDSVSMNRSEKQTSRLMIWSNRETSPDLYYKISARLENNSLRRLQLKPVWARAKSGESLWKRYRPFASGLLMVVIIALGLYHFVRRIRADQVSFRSGILLGSIVAVALAIAGVLAQWEMATTPELIISLVLVVMIIGMVVSMFYATAESLARDLPQDRLQLIDAINRGKLMYRPLGMAVFRSFAFAAVLLGLITLALDPGLVPGSTLIIPWWLSLPLNGGAIPGLMVVMMSFEHAIMLVTSFSLFLFTLLLRSTRRPWLSIFVAGGLFGLLTPPMMTVIPAESWILPAVLMGMAVTYIFYRYDFFTAMVTQLFILLISGTVGISLFNGLLHPVNLGMSAGTLAVLLLYAGICTSFGETHLAADSLKPDYVYRLAERERLKRELEIARDIQANFLPGSTPQIPGLQLASTCTPANEVGGDYYDFILLNDQRLGIVIGDVSGKGIPAAFYMTLTKGILKSLITEIDSPRQVLIRTNELFYQNARRGVFISLIYGLLDTKKRVLTFARAGHNPPIHFQRRAGDAKLLIPAGLAIGLDAGPVFAETIEEMSVRYEEGDVFLFYTDGFSEAMNAEHREYGENRILELLRKGADASPEEILSMYVQDLQQFTNGHPQHDDMTMIVLKAVGLKNG